VDTVRRDDSTIQPTRSTESAARFDARRAWPVIASYAALATILLTAAAGFAVWAVTAPEPRAVEIIIPTPSPLTVQVDGAVANPGVYTLPPGSRAQDAIAAAGGLTGESPVNLAMPLADGQQLIVVEREAEPAPSSTSEGSNRPLLDLDTATREQLETLPGIGPARAAAIIEFRDRNGPIQFLEDLTLVSGIGPATIESLRPLVTQQ
jgi:competence protein ComEA